MADLYYFPLLASDWLAGEAVSMMTPEQEGGFFHLLCHQWLSKALPCSLPNDDAALAQLSRLGEARWAQVGGFIRAQFEEVRGDPTRIRNPKLWSIHREFQAKHKKRVDAGRTGGVAKAKRKQTPSNANDLPEDSPSNATAMLQQKATNQNHNQNKRTTNSMASTEAGVLKLPKAYSAEFLQLWAEYPARSGSAAKEKASIQVAARLREGVAFDLLLEKTKAYRTWAEATGKIGTEKVMQAARFYGAAKEYEQGNWSLPAQAADTRAEHFRKRGYV